MTDDLRAILARARATISQEEATKAAATQKIADDFSRRAERLRQAVIPRLQAAREAWKEEGMVVEFQEHLEKTGTDDPTIALNVVEPPLGRPGAPRSSSLYIFGINKKGSFYIYEGAREKNSLGGKVGLVDGNMDSDAVVDNVLELVVADYLRQTRG